MSLSAWLRPSRSGSFRPRLLRYAVAVLSVLLSFFLALWLRPFTYSSPHLFFYAAILISVLYGGRGPGLASTILSALLINYYFFPPYAHFSPDPSNLIRDVYFFLSFGFICWLIDSRQESQESELQKSEQRLAAMVDSSNDGIISKDLEGIITSWNSGAKKLFGYSSSEAVGKPIQMLLPQERATEEAEILARIRGGETINHFETVRIRKNGTPIEVSVTVSPIRDRTGTIVGASKIARDITERKQSERLLHEFERDYRTLFEAMDEGFCTIEMLFNENQDPVDFRFLETNPAFLRQTGLRDVRDKTAREVLPQLEKYWFGIYGKIALTGEPARFENEAAQLHRWYDVHAFRIGEPNEAKVAVFFDDITERKQIEEAVRESEERFRVFMDNLPANAWAKDDQGRYVYLNRAYETFLGARMRDCTGKTDFDLWPPKIATAFKRVDDTVLATGKMLEATETALVHGSVHRTWQNISFPFQDAKGRKHVGGIGVDVTEKQIADERLREYVRVVEGLEEMILVVDRNYRYVIANRAFLNFRGFSEQEVIGRTAEEVVGKDVFESQVKKKMDECFSGHAVQYEMAYNFKGLGSRTLFVSYFPIESPHGVDRIACILQDITDRKAAEEELRKSEERFSRAFRNNPLAISISTESDGRFVDVNQAFLKLLGYRREDVIGHTSDELKFWSDSADQTEMRLQLRQSDHVVQRHRQYRTANGAIREADTWIESIELDGQRCLLGIIHDITEMQQLEAQLRQAQKMEAVGRLAGGIAHDFNNMLGIIMGYSDLLLERIASDDLKQRQYMSQIKKAAKKAAALTQQLLAFSRKQVVFPKVLDINEVIRNATTMLLRLVGEDVAVEFRPGLSVGNVKADPGQLEQILMNLVVNARDAMPLGGTIMIETALSELDEDYASRHPGARSGQHAVLMVSDTGCGMDDSIKSKIFEPFFTTKEAGKGTGLGLSTVYGIVKQSDGYIGVYSEPGKGTTLKIYLPSVYDKVKEPVARHEDAAFPTGSETILIVEDEKLLREVTVTLLKAGGYQVLEAKDAEEALRIMAASPQGVDLLLTDVIMPKKSGAELMAEAKLLYPNLRAVFMSGYTGDMVARHGVMIDEATFLEKPFTKRALLSKISSVLHGKSEDLSRRAANVD